MTEQTYAGFWQRVPAALVDVTLCGILSYGVVWVLAAANQEVWGTLFVPASWWLYEAYMTSSRFQATLGKLIVGVAVTDKRGHRTTFLRSTGRHFSKYLSLAVILFGFVMAGFTKRKQALHDKIAGTLIEKRPPEAGWLIASVNKFWQGDVRLVISYWIFGVIVLRILAIPMYILEAKGFLNENPEELYWEVDLAIFLYFMSATTSNVLIVVGIWRSANKYTGPVMWGRLAQAAIIIGFLVDVGRSFSS